MTKRQRIPELISEIQGELTLIGKVVNGLAAASSPPAREKETRQIYSESLGLKLHNFYTGLEQIFQKIADDLNRGVPSSRDWHRRLLRSMALEIAGIRSPVLGLKTVTRLEEFLAFRHVVRNLYGFELELGRLRRLAKAAPTAFRAVSGELVRFLEFLRAMPTSRD